MKEKTITFDRFIRYSIGIVITLLVLFLLKRLSNVLLPFFIAWLLAYFIHPLVCFFQFKLHFKSRVVSIIVSLLVVTLTLVGSLYLLVPPIIEETERFATLLQTYLQDGDPNHVIPKEISEVIAKTVDMEWIHQKLSSGSITGILKETLPDIWNFVAGSMGVVMNILSYFIILLYLVFILKDYEAISEGWQQLVPIKYRAHVIAITSDLKIGMNRYFRGQTAIALCVGILFSIGFLIIDFPVAIGLGLFIGLLNLVPYLQIAGLFPTVLLALLKSANTGENFWYVLLGAAVVFCIIQAFQDLFLTPHILGKAMHLNPAIILLSISIWGTLFGLIGLIIALPLTTLLLAYYKRYIVAPKKDKPVEEE